MNNIIFGQFDKFWYTAKEWSSKKEPHDFHFYHIDKNYIFSETLSNVSPPRLWLGTLRYGATKKRTQRMKRKWLNVHMLEFYSLLVNAEKKLSVFWIKGFFEVLIRLYLQLFKPTYDLQIRINTIISNQHDLISYISDTYNDENNLNFLCSMYSVHNKGVLKVSIWIYK